LNIANVTRDSHARDPTQTWGKKETKHSNNGRSTNH